MARFQYRLQKVFQLRERKKEQQERVVQKAVALVRQIQGAIEAKKNEIRLVRKNMLTAPHTLMQAHDDFTHLLNGQLDQLNQDLVQAQERLAYERKLLVQYQSELEALVKHKEKAYEAYLEAEKALEMKRLDEVASQRFIRDQIEQAEEEEETRRV